MKLEKFIEENKEFCNLIEVWVESRIASHDAGGLAASIEFIALNYADAVRRLTGKGLKVC